MKQEFGNSLGQRRGRRSRGMVLLLSLMVLTILATVIVQFQTDASLYRRASGFRLEQQQCRYGAESGIVAAMNLLQKGPEKLRAAAVDPESLLDPEGTAGEADPNGLLDPNGLADPNDSQGLLLAEEDRGAFMLMQTSISVGEATVEIEIQDENAKFPLIWLLRSPLAMSKGQKEFSQLAALLEADGSAANQALSRTQQLGRRYRTLPQSPIVVKAKGQKGRRRNMPYAKKLAEDRKRREIMSEFAGNWLEEVQGDPSHSLLDEPLAEQEESFFDYMGIWGHYRININTASTEVLESVFQSLGITAEQAQAVVDYRSETPFRTTNDLRNVTGLRPDIVNGMRQLSVVNSDTFSVRVTAHIGRTQYRMLASVYNDRSRMKLAAVMAQND